MEYRQWRADPLFVEPPLGCLVLPGSQSEERLLLNEREKMVPPSAGLLFAESTIGSLTQYRPQPPEGKKPNCSSWTSQPRASCRTWFLQVVRRAASRAA
jgi:hypothetical protein